MNLGASRIHGYDIPEVDISERRIDEQDFTATDLSSLIEFDRTFDLAISTEVAEHIPIKCAGNFVANLTNAAPVILFSAATPYQGGLGHTNENWVEYWNRFFQAEKYLCFDFLRDQIWHDPSIPFYYRQNILVFAAETHVEMLISKGLKPNPAPKSLIHPDMLIKAVHRKRDVVSSRHSIHQDVISYYGTLEEFDDLPTQNQMYGDTSFSK